MVQVDAQVRKKLRQGLNAPLIEAEGKKKDKDMAKLFRVSDKTYEKRQKV
jgi:hypothetical protein